MYCSLSTRGWGTGPEVRAADSSVQGMTVVISSGRSTRAERKSPAAERLTSICTFWVVWATGRRMGFSRPRSFLEVLPTSLMFFS